jgi:hypothetical protein
MTRKTQSSPVEGEEVILGNITIWKLPLHRREGIEGRGK